jgi:hypothetical protein
MLSTISSPRVKYPSRKVWNASDCGSGMSFGGQLEVLSCTYFGAQRLKIESAHLIEVQCGILQATLNVHLLHLYTIA